ncbi:MAG: HIT family protein [Candidatus Heimdallarchaeota archaeon]|nr:HIT family protein [Candidatus Heimdallarchaeota archaeon]
MVDDCLFCKIVRGEMPSHTLYEDEEVKVFLDIFPVSKGHSLVIPKKHYEQIIDVPEEEMAFLKKLPEISKKLKEVTEATGLNVVQSNGKDAGQVIGHVHFHLIPRFPEDGIMKLPAQSELDESVAKEILEKFKI